MRLALPVSVKFLHKGNKDLSRNMSSYLSLAAIENAELLAQHIQPIIDSVISGNYSLARVLPQIYSVNRDPIKSHVMTLVSILPNCDNNEKLALLTVFSYVAKENPAVSINQFTVSWVLREIKLLNLEHRNVPFCEILTEAVDVRFGNIQPYKFFAQQSP